MRWIAMGALALGLSWTHTEVAEADSPRPQAVVCQAIGLDLVVGLAGESRLDHQGQRQVTIIEDGKARTGGWATPRWAPGENGRGVASFKASDLELILKPVAPDATPGTKLSASVQYTIAQGSRVGEFRCFCEVGGMIDPVEEAAR